MVKKEKNINKKMTFVELLTEHPQAAKVLLKYNFHCIGCPLAKQETIEEGAIVHGVSPEKLIKEIKKEIEKNQESSKSRERKRKLNKS